MDTIAYNAPTLLRETEALYHGGEVAEAGRRMELCVRTRMLAELEYFGVTEFDDGTPIDADGVTTRELVNLVAWSGHSDITTLMITHAIIEVAHKAAAGGQLGRDVFRDHMFWTRKLLEGTPALEEAGAA